jgi:hypothetical protein
MVLFSSGSSGQYCNNVLLTPIRLGPASLAEVGSHFE